MDRIGTSEAGVYLGVSARRVLSLIKSGHIRAELFGGSWATDREDLAAVRGMLRSKKGKASHPLKPMKIFGSYAIAEYREGTFLRGWDRPQWFEGLTAAEAITRVYRKRYPEGDAHLRALRKDLRASRPGDASDRAALLKYARAGE
jgi:excisionase family DNA binding protein